jgi:hypothetical protein
MFKFISNEDFLYQQCLNIKSKETYLIEALPYVIFIFHFENPRTLKGLQYVLGESSGIILISPNEYSQHLKDAEDHKCIIHKIENTINNIESPWLDDDDRQRLYYDKKNQKRNKKH